MPLLLDLTPLRVSPAYRRLYAGFSLSNVGSQLAVVAIGLQVYDLTRSTAAVGVAENANSVVLVTVAPGGELLDRRSFDLTEPGLPTHPHHHEGSWAVGRYFDTPGARRLSLGEAVALVERVRAAAARGA